MRAFLGNRFDQNRSSRFVLWQRHYSLLAVGLASLRSYGEIKVCTAAGLTHFWQRIPSRTHLFKESSYALF